MNRVPVIVRQWWHLGPEFDCDLLEQLVLDAPTLISAEFLWSTTWFAAGFGQRLPRKSLCIEGRLPPGEHLIRCSLQLSHPSS